MSLVSTTAGARPIKDVLLIGLGAVGAIYAHILALSGRARVTAIARSNCDLVQSHGLHIKSRKYGDIPNWRPYRVFPSISSALDRRYSYVLLCTKAIPEILDTVSLLKPVIESHGSKPPISEVVQGREPSQYESSPRYSPTYVLMQNGLGVEKGLVKELEERRRRGEFDGDVNVIGTALWIGTNMMDGEVVHGDFDRVQMGVYPPSSSERQSESSTQEQERKARQQEILDDFGRILTDGGSTVTLVKNIELVKYRKNFWNLGLATFATLTRHPLPSVFQDPSIEARITPTLHAVLKETIAVGRALGFPDAPPDTAYDVNDYLPSSAVEETVENTAVIHRRPDSNHVPSMLLDLKNGRPMEIEVVVGEVVRVAKEKGVDIPRIETIYAMLTVVQNELLKQKGYLRGKERATL